MEGEEEGGSKFNTAGKLVSAHRAQGTHPLKGVIPLPVVGEVRKRGGSGPTTEKGIKFPFQWWVGGGRAWPHYHHYIGAISVIFTSATPHHWKGNHPL